MKLSAWNHAATPEAAHLDIAIGEGDTKKMSENIFATYRSRKQRAARWLCWLVFAGVFVWLEVLAVEQWKQCGICQRWIAHPPTNYQKDGSDGT